MKIERKLYAVVLVSILLVAGILSTIATRTITDTGDTVDTFIRNSKGNYWTATGANLQLAINDLGASRTGYVIIPANSSISLVGITNTYNIKIIDLSSSDIQQVFYVSTTGNDLTGSGTINNPWKTLYRASNSTQPGDIVKIRGGTYTSRQYIKDNGTIDKWVTYQNYTGEKPFFNCTTLTANYIHEVIEISYSSYIRLSGITVANSSASGIQIQYSANQIRIDNCTVRNTSIRGIAASPESSGLTIENITAEYCFIRNTNNGWAGGAAGETISFSAVKKFDINHNILWESHRECIDVKSGCNHGTISNNTINTTSTYGVTYGSIGIYCDGYSAINHNISIFNNRLDGNGTGINIGAESTGAIREIYVYNNIVRITNSTVYGILISNNAANGAFKNLYIYSNTVAGVSGGGSALRCTQNRLKLVNLVIKNNILQCAGYYTYSFSKLNVTDGLTTISDNIFYRLTGAGANLWTAAEDPANGYGTTYTIANPLFVSKGTGNLYVNFTSRAIDNATSTLIPAFDFNGDARPNGRGYDIGAYEMSVGLDMFNIPTSKRYAPIAGDAFWNATTYVLMIYDGTAWRHSHFA